MCYHSGQEDHVHEIRAVDQDKMQFTPRLYTTDAWGTSMTIKDFQKIEDYQNFVAYFFGGNLAEHQDQEQQITWELDFFPRGIRYNKAKLISIFSFQGCMDIPEACLKTVRLRVTCKDDLEEEQRFKVGEVDYSA